MRFVFPGNLDDDRPEVAELWTLGCRGMEQQGANIVAYFETEQPLPLAGRWEAVPERDYLAEYRAGLEAIDLGALVIAPTHRQVTVSAGQRVLWLDPGSAFGTGHHQTTRLALQALIELDPAGLRVLDVGSGSGILAIAADLLGAARCRGLDNDPATVPVAQANARLNRSRAGFRVGTLGGERGRYEVVVANLFAALHLELRSRYERVVVPGGTLLLTGILADQAPEVTAALAPAFVEPSILRLDEWVLLRARRA